MANKGLKASDILRRLGKNISTVIKPEDKTKFGFAKELTSNKKFKVRVETLAPGNNRGFGKNEEDSRVFYVTGGTLYVAKKTEKEVETLQFPAGSYFVAEPGVEHSYASSGTSEVSILVVETGNYEKGWKSLEAATESDKIEMASFLDNAKKAEQMKTIPPRRANSKAKEQAIAEERERNKGGVSGKNKVTNPFDALSDPNLKVTNSRPMGPQGLND